MVIYINIVSNISAISLVNGSGERLQDQWSSGYSQGGAQENITSNTLRITMCYSHIYALVRRQGQRQ